MKLVLLGALVFASLSPVAARAVTPFDGAWRLDQSKSHFEGTTFTYTKKPDGLWTLTDGASVTFDFRTDGKPYKTLDPEETTTTNMENDHSWTYTDEFKGKVTRKTHGEVSPDEKTMTEHTTAYRPDGTTAESDVTYTRVTGAKGFEGKWKTTRQHTDTPENYTMSTGSDGTLTWTIPAMQGYVVSHLDGTPAPIHGPTVPDGFTLELAKTSAHELTYKVAMKSKILNEGKLVVSTDGRMLTDTSWSPGKENEKTISVYMKQ